MNLEQTKIRLGEFVNNLSIAQSYESRSDVINKMCDYISSRGLDVDDQYLDFVKKVDRSTVDVQIRYVPIYRVTSLARLYWKDQKKEDNDPIEHQEFVRFTFVFDATSQNKRNRISNLNLLKVIDKKAAKSNEETYTNIESYENNDVKLLKTEQIFTPSVVLDVPLLDDEVYPLETSYILSKSDIDKQVDVALKQTKSYKRLKKEKEKWSSIEKMEVEVVLVPIARIKIGLHEQYVNCANGEMDIQYEKNKEISHNLLVARWMTYPTIIIFTILSVLSFIFKWHLEARFENLPAHILGNITDFIWIILVVLGIIFSLCALPSRKGIVKRATNNKDKLRICRICARLLIDVCVALLVMFLMCL